MKGTDSVPTVMGRKQKNVRKPRTEYVYGTTVGEISELVVHIDERTGEFSFGNEMTNVYAETSYERPKKPKVVFRLPQTGTDLTFDVSKILKRDFDYLCAVDTNTKKINNKRVSVTGVLNFRPHSIIGPREIQQGWKFDSPFGIEFVEIKSDKVENMCWLAVYEELAARGIVNRMTRIGMVVDSDLGNINDYNHRRKPFFENFFLPKNLTLMYASADTGKDNVLNYTFSIADSLASQAIKAIETGLVEFNTKNLNHRLYEGMRLIVPNLVEAKA